jgi:dTDP-4-dehydrorhamnose reductase
VVREVRPSVVINCAGYTAVDRAEEEREVAEAVNGVGPGMIGRAAAEAGAFVVHFSTDYVFDGTATRPYREEDPTAPLGVYGHTKATGERALAASGAAHVIVRTSWLFGLHGRSFPRTMWERATKRQATRVVDDQRGRLTYTVDLAGAVWGMIGGLDGMPSILHVANAGEATWYDVARRVFEAAGMPELVTPCTTAEYPTPAKRPAYSVLDTSRYEALTARPLPSWQNALDRFTFHVSRFTPSQR